MKSQDLLEDFTQYCKAHPHERFWQALRNWSGWGFIWASKEFDPRDAVDTFYWEKNKPQK